MSRHGERQLALSLLKRPPRKRGASSKITPLKRGHNKGKRRRVSPAKKEKSASESPHLRWGEEDREWTLGGGSEKRGLPTDQCRVSFLGREQTRLHYSYCPEIQQSQNSKVSAEKKMAEEKSSSLPVGARTRYEEEGGGEGDATK